MGRTTLIAAAALASCVAMSPVCEGASPQAAPAEAATDTLVYANGGKNTVPGDRQIVSSRGHVRFEGTGRAKGLLCVGSSYAWHGPSGEKLGWFGDWGMAASAREKDCVHVLWERVRRVCPEAPLCIVQSASWERNYTGDVEFLERRYPAVKDFRPEWICIITTVANAPRTLVEQEPVDRHYAMMVDWFRRTNPDAKIVLSTGSSGPVVAKAIRAFAAERGYPVVDFNEFLSKPGMRATGLFKHGGVASHPSDAGMAEMGRRYAEALGLLPPRTGDAAPERERMGRLGAHSEVRQGRTQGGRHCQCMFNLALTAMKGKEK